MNSLNGMVLITASLFDEPKSIPALVIRNGAGIRRIPARSLDTKFPGTVFFPTYMAEKCMPRTIQDDTTIYTAAAQPGIPPQKLSINTATIRWVTAPIEITKAFLNLTYLEISNTISKIPAVTKRKLNHLLSNTDG